MYLVGSRAFFEGYADFSPKDKDFLILDENPKGYKIFRQTSLNGKCLFEWKKFSPNKFIEIHKNNGTGMLIGKFLVPEVCKDIGFTIEHLKKLEPLLKKLDDKHKYESVIFYAYLENGDFVLTQEQRDEAYRVYKEARNGN